MNGFVFEDLTIERRDVSPTRIELHFRGEATSGNLDRPFESFMRQLTQEARERNVELEFHLGGLHFCRSGFVAHLVSLVEEARANALRVRLYFDLQRAWQRKQMHSFQTLVRGAPTVEVCEEPAHA